MHYITPQVEEYMLHLSSVLMASVEEGVYSSSNESFTEGDDLYFD